jgi:phosphopantothenoylcysteine decarboxylase/phosphopantothenate--cysteine ligase
MLEAVANALSESDVMVMAAAPADYQPSEVSDAKLPRTNGSLTLNLVPTDDVLVETLEARRPGCVVVGFALESNNGLERARSKLDRKRLDLIVLNSAREEAAGFEVETNRTTFITQAATHELPLMSKRQVAEHLLDEVEGML